MNLEESGHDFELRALKIARAIHDPFHTQGAIMHKGQERDGVFNSDEAVHVYEFTTDFKKAKAEKDAAKICQLLVDLQKIPANSYKSFTGWFVTRDEPTAEQRGAVKAEAKKSGVTIHAISVSTLQRRLCDSEEYLRCRDNTPFGSISYGQETAGLTMDVDVEFECSDQTRPGIDELSGRMLDGFRALIIGEFGVGKSHALRGLYQRLRKVHLGKKQLTPFPVHINLRECVGLRSPAEILRRHSEEIGFANDRSLISAWRAGACILLLDGFDEVVPTRWLGGAADLKGVRWEALAPVRRFVEETPAQTSIVVCGRAHYFSGQGEMLDCLGFQSSANVVGLRDFTDEQVAEYVKGANISGSLPEWLPTRPLLIGYLVATGGISEIGDSAEKTQAGAWTELFDFICRREARMFTAVRPETIRAILSRVATLARSQGEITGPVGMAVLQKAFIDVNNHQPDEEENQLLLRLPGLAIAAGVDEARLFVDENLADTAYGVDLAAYLASPYLEHPLAKVASWVTSASDLGVDVAAQALHSDGISARATLTIASRRQDENCSDAVLADILRVATSLDPIPEVVRDGYTVEGVIFENLTVSGSDPVSERITYQDCVIQVLDITSADDVSGFPHFHRCLIGFLDGGSSIPTSLAGRFVNCGIEQYAAGSQTTAGIMQLKLDLKEKIALTILKKIYSQRGSGRKEGALSRGLDKASRPLVSGVLTTMLSEGWLTRTTSGKNVLYLPVKNRRAAALRALEKPGDFRLGSD